MSNYVDLALVKAHLRVTHARDDTYIELLTKAAESHVSSIVGLPLDDAKLQVEEQLDPSLKTAILLCIADLYENRSAQDAVQKYKNAAFDCLVAPHRVLGV